MLLLVFFTVSCADSFSSIKRGLTGAKKTSADEFLIKKKDPLILPPDFENLPIPDEETAAEEMSTFEKNLETLLEEDSSTSSSVESSILKKIRSK